jgi:transcription initiation factor IIE alpha subunit
VNPATLRHSILRQIEAHEATGSSDYLDDKKIANALGAELPDIQRQLEILEDDDHIDLAKTFGPTYAARLRPKGMKALEVAE